MYVYDSHLTLHGISTHFEHRILKNEHNCLYDSYFFVDQSEQLYRLLYDFERPKESIKFINITTDDSKTIELTDELLHELIDAIGVHNILEHCLEDNQLALYLRDKYNL